MKKRYVVLAVLSFIFFTNVSCDEDDTLNPEQEPEQVEFTTTNYIYEGDLRIYYLETKNTELELQIVAWQQIPDSDPGYNDAQASIVEASAQIVNNEEEANSIVSPENAFFIINPVIPPLPAPLPCLCLDIYNTVSNIVLQPGTDQMSLTITTVADQSTLINTNANSQISTIANTNGLGRYQTFELSQSDFTGEAMITVQTENGSYSFLSNFQDL
ncbi:hypothetical protein [Lacinutrix sp. Bg11-31]|uniref:hypothetical protein n=1 Tax=Lacinutrix sp. Bg11-31 TaxID=2057808 RepID=UPI000C311189|nr:hypothetical protein [Lacinutrix sp. Bg11-31]AUC83609.1 hypothetical protein CW733_16330 [Lacinutrix sp. Bg11-31]